MTYCCVPFCTSNYKKNKDLSFHEFPSYNNLRQAWLRAICRKDFYPGDKHLVCSIHFKKDDFVPNITKRRLKPTVVPSVFPGYPSWHKVHVGEKSRTPQKRRSRKSSSKVLPKRKREDSVSEAEADVKCTDLNASSEINTEFNEPKLVNCKDEESQTKIEKSLDKLYNENRKLKKRLCSKNKQIACLKEKRTAATLNEKLEYYEKKACFTDVENVQVSKGEGSPEKSRNEPQKIVFIASGSSNVCIDEADMETILKAMNGEDVSERNSESSSTALTLVDTTTEHSDTDNPEMGDDEIRPNDTISSEIPVQILDVQGNILPNHQVSYQCTTPNLATKKKADDMQLQSRIEKTFPITEEPKNPVELKTCNCKKDEVDLYAALLATKLKSMDEKSRHVAMNKIDNLIFKMKMEAIEGQQRPQSLGANQKSLNASQMQKNDF